MASAGWYRQKMLKLKKEKIAEMKERDAISAIDEEKTAEDRPIINRGKQWGHGWGSLGTRTCREQYEEEQERLYGAQVRAIQATLVRCGLA